VQRACGGAVGVWLACGFGNLESIGRPMMGRQFRA
jgi:hypothetical protein